MNNMSTLPHDEVRPEMDDLLHDYFQAQVPQPWPAFQAPKQTRMKRPESLWSRYSGRLALAACITLLVAGYLTLGGYFPGTQVRSDLEDATPRIGHTDKDGGKKGKAPNPNPQHVQQPLPHPLHPTSTTTTHPPPE